MSIKSADDFYWNRTNSTYQDTLQFLLDLKTFVGQLDVPDNCSYRQIAHSGDSKFVGDGVHRPAVLDASYEYRNQHYLSISIPDFTSSQPAFVKERKSASYKEIIKSAFDGKMATPEYEYVENTGLNDLTFNGVFKDFLKRHGVNVEEIKLGTSIAEGTCYVEASVNENDYYMGKKIIQRYVHGNDTNVAELQKGIHMALEPYASQQPYMTISPV